MKVPGAANKDRAPPLPVLPLPNPELRFIAPPSALPLCPATKEIVPAVDADEPVTSSTFPEPPPAAMPEVNDRVTLSPATPPSRDLMYTLPLLAELPNPDRMVIS